MTPGELRLHIATLQRLKCDNETLEAKAAAGELPQHLWKTLFAFSNTGGGGDIFWAVGRGGIADVGGVRGSSLKVSVILLFFFLKKRGGGFYYYWAGRKGGI